MDTDMNVHDSAEWTKSCTSICIKVESSLYTFDTVITGSADNNQVDPVDYDIVVTDEEVAGNRLVDTRQLGDTVT